MGVVRSRDDFVNRLKEGYWILTGCRVCGLRGDEPSSIRDMVVEIVGGGAGAGESVGVEVGNCLNLRGLGRILGSGAILMSRAECYMNYRGVNEVVSRPTKLDLNNCYFLGVDSQIVRLIEIDGTPAPEPPSVAGENQLKETAGEYRNTSIWSFLTG